MLKAEHVLLTPLSNDDISILFNWINDRELVLYNASYKPIHEKQHREWFEIVQQRKDMIIFCIRLIETDKLIGTCQLHSIHNINRNAELQIRIGDISEQGKGYGTEAVCLLLKFAFKDLNLHRVYLHVFHNNLPAIRAYEKAGFVREGLLRKHTFIDGHYVDVVVMGVVREEFYAK